jgi:hypothetical protein
MNIYVIKLYIKIMDRQLIKIQIKAIKFSKLSDNIRVMTIM